MPLVSWRWRQHTWGRTSRMPWAFARGHTTVCRMAPVSAVVETPLARQTGLQNRHARQGTALLRGRREGVYGRMGVDGTQGARM
jgi:hypothetical protein